MSQTLLARQRAHQRATPTALAAQAAAAGDARSDRLAPTAGAFNRAAAAALAASREE